MATHTETIREIGTELQKSYAARTSPKLKLLDAFSACALITAVLQFVYAKLVGTFPFNSFLAGFFCCVGAFVLTLALRMKIADAGGSGGALEFGGYALAMCTLFAASWNYIG